MCVGKREGGVYRTWSGWRHMVIGKYRITSGNLSNCTSLVNPHMQVVGIYRVD